MKNPFVILDESSRVWCCGEFHDVGPEYWEECGISPLDVESELASALKVDPQSAVKAIQPFEPHLPAGAEYWDGRYGRARKIVAATDTHVWIDSPAECQTVTHFEYHRQARQYVYPML